MDRELSLLVFFKHLCPGIPPDPLPDGPVCSLVHYGVHPLGRTRRDVCNLRYQPVSYYNRAAHGRSHFDLVFSVNGKDLSGGLGECLPGDLDVRLLPGHRSHTGVIKPKQRYLKLGTNSKKIGRIFKVDPKKVISLVLLRTNKNTGLAAGLALALFGDRTALPAAVSTIFMIVYIVWLGFKQRKSS